MITMQFTDPEQIQSRARAVRDLLGKERAALTHSETRVAVPVERTPEEPAVFDAVRGYVTWTDLDGEIRALAIPAGTTSESVAALLWGLAGVGDWS
jgi:hypothetical protein